MTGSVKRVTVAFLKFAALPTITGYGPLDAPGEMR